MAAGGKSLLDLPEEVWQQVFRILEAEDEDRTGTPEVMSRLSDLRLATKGFQSLVDRNIRIVRCQWLLFGKQKGDFLFNVGLGLQNQLPRWRTWPTLEDLFLFVNWPRDYMPFFLQLLRLRCPNLRRLGLFVKPSPETKVALKFSLAIFNHWSSLRVLHLENFVTHHELSSGLKDVSAIEELTLSCIGDRCSLETPPSLQQLVLDQRYKGEERGSFLDAQASTALRKLMVHSTWFRDLVLPSSLSHLELRNATFLAGCPGRSLELPNLVSLTLCGTRAEAPFLFAFPTGLLELELSELDGFLVPFGELGTLRCLRDLKLCSLPELQGLPGLADLQQLESLKLQSLDALLELPELQCMTSLARLEIADCKHLLAVPTLQGLQGLTSLRLSGLTQVIQLPEIWHLRALKHLEICHFPAVKWLPAWGVHKKLTTLTLEDMESLVRLPPMEGLSSLTALTIHTMAKLGGLPLVRSLQRLRSIMLYDCPKLAALDLCKLPSLKSVMVMGCSALKGMKGVGPGLILVMDDMTVET